MDIGTGSTMIETNTPYDLGYEAGYSLLPARYNNPYRELSLAWVDYEMGYDDGWADRLKDTRDTTSAL